MDSGAGAAPEGAARHRPSAGEQREAAAATDPVLSALERRHKRLVELRDYVRDRGRTSFVLVTIPERLAIDETARAGGRACATRRWMSAGSS